MTQLLVTEIFPPKTGGSGRWFWEVYSRLPRDEYYIAAGEDPRQAEFDTTHDLRLSRVPLSLTQWGVKSLAALAGYRRALRALRPLLDRHGITRLHCARCLPEGAMARWIKLRRGVPYICYVHGEEITNAAESRELRWILRRVMRGADFLVANSSNTRRLLLADWGLPESSVRLLHPGVDTRRFRPARRDPAVRARLGWDTRPVVLTVGRLQKRKGHDVFLDALTTIRRTVPDVLYAVVGEGEELPALRTKVTSLGLENAVQFLGGLRDEALIECYQQCDLFVLPNRTVGRDIEGFGIVLLEAQACGKPVIAGASGGTAETMRIPETGRVVSCDGPEEVAVLVAELLRDRDRREAMGRAGRQWVVDNFDWEVLCRQAAALFRLTPEGTELPAAVVGLP
jgi:phosphatidylinositol alpha-1,6-mannosyltransferase